MVKFKDIVDFYIDGFSGLSDGQDPVVIILASSLLCLLFSSCSFQNEMKVI